MAETINILLIEDNQGDVRLVREILKEASYFEPNLYVATTVDEGLRCIATKLIHVILLDLNLPDSRGLETFKKIHRFAMNIPIIILSVLSNKELVYEAMLDGAQDYLIKGEFAPETLVRSIRYAMWLYQFVVAY